MTPDREAARWRAPIDDRTALTVLAAHGWNNPGCSCGHDHDAHRPRCQGRDSYDQRCACPSFELAQSWREEAEAWADDSHI